MPTVEIVDRSSLMENLYRELVLDPRQTAIVTVDMHRGHLDMDVATMPASPEDAGRSDPEFLYRVLEIAIAAGATTRNIPFDQPHEEGTCIVCGKPSKRKVYFARAY